MSVRLSHDLDATDESYEVASPERRLFMGVIVNAVLDASGRGRTAERGTLKEQQRIAAVRWFREAGEDFEIVCSLAGLEPSVVQSAVLDYVAATKADPAARIGHKRGCEPRLRVATGRGITRRAIANVAGVSAATVARVLDNRGNTTAKTRLRVEAAIRQLTIPEKLAA